MYNIKYKPSGIVKTHSVNGMNVCFVDLCKEIARIGEKIFIFELLWVQIAMWRLNVV